MVRIYKKKKKKKFQSVHEECEQGREWNAEPGPVGQFPVGIVGVPMPAGSLSIPSVESRRVCSNLLETPAQPRPDLKGYVQLAGHGQVCTTERKEGQEEATERGGGDE